MKHVLISNNLIQGLMGTFNSFNSTRVRFSPTRKGALSNVDHNRLSLRCDFLKLRILVENINITVCVNSSDVRFSRHFPAILQCLHLNGRGRYHAHNFDSATPQKSSSTKRSGRAIDAECMIYLSKQALYIPKLSFHDHRASVSIFSGL